MNSSESCNGDSLEPIDAVYTWVDGDDPGWQAQWEASGHPSDLPRHRYRNHDELRYSLRSLEQFAPWVRTVYLVTSGQQPEWLNLDSSRLQLVAHDQIFPDAHNLPTFNSHAIELNLHRIPGLSQRFLYINDDCFFGKSCQPGDFVGADGEVGYLEDIHLDRQLGHSEPSDLACRHTRELAEARFGGAELEWMPAHTPQLYDRDQVVELEQQFSKEFAETSASRFRSPEDLVLRIAYAVLSKSLGKQQILLESGNSKYSFIRLHGDVSARLKDFAFLQQLRPNFFCLNDDLASGRQSDVLSIVMRQFLESCFPQPSAFEVGGE